jgi:DNA polymerase III alpha subunit
VPAGETPASHLQSLTHAGMARRWPSGVPAKVQAQVEHELKLIAELRYEPYFLTVEDIVRYARTQGILCQAGLGGQLGGLLALGLLKIDCLGLGMLSTIHRAFDLIQDYGDERLTLATVPAEDPETYAMIERADTVGVFQIESRAQMVMLPRLKVRPIDVGVGDWGCTLPARRDACAPDPVGRVLHRSKFARQTQNNCCRSRHCC